MPVIPSPADATHEAGGARFTSLATPSRGSAETSVWRVEIAPGTPATPHSLTREEVLVVLDGTAVISIDGVGSPAVAGDTIVVPPGVEFGVANEATAPLRMLCCLPVGGRALLRDGTPFTPPWAR